MFVGIQEIVFFLSVVVMVGVGFALTNGRAKWLWGLLACVAFAIAVTPPDLGSAFVVAPPISLLYVFLMMRRADQTADKA